MVCFRAVTSDVPYRRRPPACVVRNVSTTPQPAMPGVGRSGTQHTDGHHSRSRCGTERHPAHRKSPQCRPFPIPVGKPDVGLCPSISEFERPLAAASRQARRSYRERRRRRSWHATWPRRCCRRPSLSSRDRAPEESVAAVRRLPRCGDVNRAVGRGLAECAPGRSSSRRPWAPSRRWVRVGGGGARRYWAPGGFRGGGELQVGGDLRVGRGLRGGRRLRAGGGFEPVCVHEPAAGKGSGHPLRSV